MAARGKGGGAKGSGATGGGGQSGNARWIAAGRAKAAEKTANRLKITLAGVVCLLIVGAIVVAVLSPSDDSTRVPPPGLAERTDTVTLLRQAHTTQQICYGWRLRSGGASFGDPPVSIGSSLGDNVPVDSDPARCPRWVEIDASIRYTSASSESSDSAWYQVTSSADLAHIDFDRGLQRLGVDSDQFIDDPGRAICQAATFLPLLVSEEGAGSATRAAPPAAAGAAPAQLPDPGNDFWRDRWAFLLGAVGLFLLTALFLAIGVFERRHQRQKSVGSGAGRGLTADLVVAPGNGRGGSGRRR